MVEICATHGDSGGPTFLNGRIAAVTSAGVGYPVVTTDVNFLTDSSFGEIGFDTRVAMYQDWIDDD